MTSADADVSSLVSLVVAAFHGSATILRTICNSSMRKQDVAEVVKAQELLLDGLEDAERQVARVFASGKRTMCDAYGQGHDTTKYELARLCDAIKIQVQGPLKQFEVWDDVVLDVAQMLDIVLCKKKAAMDICEQLCRMPDPQVPSVFSAVSAESQPPGSKPCSGHSRLRRDSQQSPASSKLSLDTPSATQESFDNVSARGIIQTSSASGYTISGSDRRQSAMSHSSQTSPQSPPHPSAATIESLSHRLSVATNLASHSNSNPSTRQASVSGAPLEQSVSNISTLTALGTPPTPISSRPSFSSMTSTFHRSTTNGQSSNTQSAETMNQPATRPLSPATSHHSETSITVEDPNKKNDYHGFCRGAWEIRKDAKKGLIASVVPLGMYKNKDQFRCRHCMFAGNATISGKTKSYDNRVQTDTTTGVQYKWMFLAKSHVKVLGGRAAQFGCTECVDQGRSTDIYADCAALMEHIHSHHLDGVKAAEKPADPFWQGESISPEGSWDLYLPTYQPYEIQSPIVWTMD